MSKPAPIRYRTLNWSSYNAALCKRGSLTVWFDPSTPWHAAPSGKRGAQPVYSDAAIQACLTVKVLFGLPLRQATGFVASLLKPAGLDWPVSDYSTLCRRQKTLAVQLPYRGSGGPLHLLVDSTGIKVRGEGEWHARKHGGARRRIRPCRSDHVWMAPWQELCSGPALRSVAAMYAASDLRLEVPRALMKSAGGTGPDQWPAVCAAPVRTGCRCLSCLRLVAITSRCASPSRCRRTLPGGDPFLSPVGPGNFHRGR